MHEPEADDRLVCPVCGGQRFVELYPATFTGQYRPHHVAITDHGYGLTGCLVRCRACAMVTVHPRPAGEQLVQLYAELQDPSYQEETAGRRDSFVRVLRELRRLSPPNLRLLDIGASTGIFVDSARQHGFDATGIEPSRWAVEEAAKTFRIPLIEGTLPHPSIPARHFGAAVLLDVIEHVDDPRGLVEQARETLVDGGLLVVTTPDFDSLARRLLGQRWWHCRLAHVQYFSRATLHRLLRDCGFVLERVMRIGRTFRLHYWFSRLEGRPLVAGMLEHLRASSLGRTLLDTRVRINFFDSVTFFARFSGR